MISEITLSIQNIVMPMLRPGNRRRNCDIRNRFARRKFVVPVIFLILKSQHEQYVNYFITTLEIHQHFENMFRLSNWHKITNIKKMA